MATQKEVSLFCGIIGLVSAVIATSCGRVSAPGAGVSAGQPSTVISGVNNGVVGSGQSLGQSPAGGDAIAKASHFNPLGLVIQTAFASGGGINSVCDAHARPLGLSQSSSDYPAYVFFCKLAENTGSPDSVQGSYSLVQSIACMLDAQGLVFDGQAHQMTGAPDSSCFSANQLASMGNPGPMTFSVTATQPAAFNPYFDTGVVIQTPSFGTFSLGAKVSGSKLEFIAFEDQTAIAANKTGVYTASFDTSTGELHYESRHDRFSCTQAGSCGWSRHDRIYASLVVSGGNVTGLNTLSGVSAEIFNNSGSYNSDIETISGDLVNGLKARLWNVGNTSTSSDLGDAGKYTEIVNNRCYTRTDATANCGSNTGIALPASGLLPFTLHPSTTYTSTQAWLAGYGGLKFTAATLADTQ